MRRENTIRSARVPSGPHAMRLFFGLIVALLLALGIASTVHAETASSDARASVSYSASGDHHQQEPVVASSEGSSDLAAVACVIGVILGVILGVMVFARLLRGELLTPARRDSAGSVSSSPIPLIQQLLHLRLERAQLQVSRT